MPRPRELRCSLPLYSTLPLATELLGASRFLSRLSRNLRTASYAHDEQDEKVRSSVES